MVLDHEETSMGGFPGRREVEVEEMRPHAKPQKGRKGLAVSREALVSGKGETKDPKRYSFSNRKMVGISSKRSRRSIC